MVDVGGISEEAGVADETTDEVEVLDNDDVGTKTSEVLKDSTEEEDDSTWGSDEDEETPRMSPSRAAGTGSTNINTSKKGKRVVSFAI